MTKEEFNEKYVGERIAIHCETEELAEEFIELAHNVGYEWAHATIETYWDKYKDKTCYTLEDGYIQYGRFYYYETGYYTIIEFKGVDKMEDLKVMLKVGRVVETKEGKKYLVLPDRLISYSGYLDLKIYDNNIKSNTYDDFDIVRIFDAPLDKIKHRSWTFGSDIGLELVWERPIKKVFSEKEIFIAKCIDKEFKYLIREEDNSFWAYVNKPVRFRDSWETPFGEISNMKAFKHLFQQIQFEDAEPTLISDIIGG